MEKLTNELLAKVKKAQSLEEVKDILKADNKDESIAEQLWKELEHVRGQDNKELSLEEIEAINGGADRDWAAEGCAAGVQSGSWCWSNDRCISWDVTYSNEPTQYNCAICGRPLYEGVKGEYATSLLCRVCDKT